MIDREERIDLTDRSRSDKDQARFIVGRRHEVELPCRNGQAVGVRSDPTFDWLDIHSEEIGHGNEQHVAFN